jgi:hypothetical protein
MPCSLTVSGTNFDVDEYLSKADWNGVEINVHYKGQQRGFTGRFGIFVDSGFSLTVSEADFADFEAQQNDLITFVKKYKSNFDLLKQYQIDWFHEFDFGLSIYLTNRFLKSYILSVELLQLVAETGMEIRMSNWVERDDDYLRRRARKHKKAWPIKK